MLSLYIVLWLVALLVLGAYFGISRLVPQTSVALVILLFLVRQATVFAKVWSRLLFYSAQCALYHDLRRIPVLMEAAPLPHPEKALLVQGLESLTESVTPTEPEQVPEARTDHVAGAPSES